MTKQQLTPHDVRRIAVAALMTPRTVKRWIDGSPVRELTRVRIERAVRELGIDLDQKGNRS